MIIPSSLLEVAVQLVPNLLQLVNRLVTTCEQTCDNLFADLIQVVRFVRYKLCRLDTSCADLIQACANCIVHYYSDYSL